jgi:hypothetical protein
MKFSFLLSGLFFKQAFGANMYNAIPHPTPCNKTFVVTDGEGLDQYQCGGQNLPMGSAWLNATLFIHDIDLSSVDYISLVIPAFDVDIPDEVDHAYMNGRKVGSFIGSDSNWHLNTFPLEIDDVVMDQFNEISIHVDEMNQGWCVSIDWVAVDFETFDPFTLHSDVLIHDSAGCADLQVTLKFPNPSATNCNVQGSLLSSDNLFLGAITDYRSVGSDDGYGEVDFIFDDSILGDAGEEGPFTVNGVLVTCDNGAQYLKPVAHVTAAYTLFDMQCPGVDGPPPTPPPTPAPHGGAYGDPHIEAWNAEQFDFHGVCDLVLARNAEFGNRAGLDLHIRTKKMAQWSYVDSAVARIGSDTLEVRGGKMSNFWINGIQGDGNTDELLISEYPIEYERIDEISEKFVIDLGDGERIVFKTWNSFVSIRVENPGQKNFAGSVGLMGTFPEGLKIGRDKTIIDDINAFGQEWQVLSTEQNLFHDIEGPQHPEQCDIPSSVDMRRRLAESLVTVEEAEKACIGADSKDKELCIFDVMATNDQSSAGAY